MKKILFSVVILFAISAYGQSRKYGGLVSLSASIKSPDTITNQYQVRPDGMAFAVYEPIFTMVAYDNMENMFSVAAGVGFKGFDPSDENSVSILFGIGPQIDFVNSKQYRSIHQKFLGSALFFNIENREKFELRTLLSYTERKTNAFRGRSEKLNFQLQAQAKMSNYFSVGASGMYRQLFNMEYPIPLSYDRYFTYSKYYKSIKAFIMFHRSSLVVAAGPLFEKTDKEFPFEDGSFNSIKKRWGIEVRGEYRF